MTDRNQHSTHVRLCLLLVCLALLAQPVRALDAVAEPALTPSANGYIVKLKAPLLQSSGAKKMTTLMPNVYYTEDTALAEQLLKKGLAEYVTPNSVVQLYDSPESTMQGHSGWVYDALQGWTADKLGLDGSGVRIAVLDSGLDPTNTDLPQDSIENGFDYVDGNETMSDPLGHGTKVAQMICAVANDFGATGIARGATIVPLRCFNKGGGATSADLIQAICEAVDKFNCKIINMSWGMSKNEQWLQDAIDYAAERGAILVASAGNVGDFPKNTVLYPAGYPNVIGVGSVNESMLVAFHSEQTEAVCVCAPGEQVPLWYGGNTVYESGTSYASPCVAAMLALCVQADIVSDASSAQELLCRRARDRGEPGYDTAYGNGTLTVSSLIPGNFLQKTGGSLILAAYTDREKQRSCQVLTQAETAAVLEDAFAAYGAKARLFAVNSLWIPTDILS